MMMTAIGYAMIWSALNGAGPLTSGVRGEVVSIRAVGVGYPPRHLRGVRATLMAQRAAEVVAVADLARRLGYGRKARVRGFRYVSASVRPDGSVEVVVEKRVRR